MILTSTMATPAEQDLVLSEAESGKERAQGFGILRLQEDKSAAEKASGAAAMRSGDGRWQAPIFALARKASETFSGGIHVLPKVTEIKTSPFAEEWGGKGKFRPTVFCTMTMKIDIGCLDVRVVSDVIHDVICCIVYVFISNGLTLKT